VTQSNARLERCAEDHWHLIDESDRRLPLALRSKRQALDQLNEATRNGRFYIHSQKRVEGEIKQSDMPDKHESDGDYLIRHSKDYGFFEDLVH